MKSAQSAEGGTPASSAEAGLSPATSLQSHLTMEQGAGGATASASNAMIEEDQQEQDDGKGRSAKGKQAAKGRGVPRWVPKSGGGNDGGDSVLREEDSSYIARTSAKEDASANGRTGSKEANAKGSDWNGRQGFDSSRESGQRKGEKGQRRGVAAPVSDVASTSYPAAEVSSGSAKRQPASSPPVASVSLDAPTSRTKAPVAALSGSDAASAAVPARERPHREVPAATQRAVSVPRTAAAASNKPAAKPAAVREMPTVSSAVRAVADLKVSLGAGVVAVQGEEIDDKDDEEAADEFQTVKSKKQQKADKLEQKRKEEEDAKKQKKREARLNRRREDGEEAVADTNGDVVGSASGLADSQAAPAEGSAAFADDVADETGGDPPLPMTRGGLHSFGQFGAIGSSLSSSHPSKEIVAIWERPSAASGARRPPLRPVGKPPPYDPPRPTRQWLLRRPSNASDTGGRRPTRERSDRDRPRMHANPRRTAQPARARGRGERPSGRDGRGTSGRGGRGRGGAKGEAS